MAAISIDGTPMTALPADANQINYDNSNSRLSDTQVQDAIDTLANDSSTFVGTTTQWNNLTTAQKKAYKYRLLTDDYTDASIGNLSALHTTDKSSVVGAVNEVKDGLTSRAVIVGGGEISSNSSATVQLLSSHLYIVTLGHPYSDAGMAIVASYTSGSNKVTWIKTRTGVTISEDSSLVLTIEAGATVWYTVVDMGAI